MLCNALYILSSCGKRVLLEPSLQIWTHSTLNDSFLLWRKDIRRLSSRKCPPLLDGSHLKRFYEQKIFTHRILVDLPMYMFVCRRIRLTLLRNHVRMFKHKPLTFWLISTAQCWRHTEQQIPAIRLP